MPQRRRNMHALANATIDGRSHAHAVVIRLEMIAGEIVERCQEEEREGDSVAYFAFDIMLARLREDIADRKVAYNL